MSLRDQVAQTLTDEVLVKASHAEQVIKNEAIRSGGFGPTTQEDSLAASHAVIMAAIGPALDAAEQSNSTVQRAAKILVAGADRRVLDATAHEPAARAAIATLDSEREMNAVLTEENERLRVVLDAAEQPKMCGTCKHWLPTARDADVRAVCNLGVIREGLGRYPITDRDFGCILHEAQP